MKCVVCESSQIESVTSHIGIPSYNCAHCLSTVPMETAANIDKLRRHAKAEPGNPPARKIRWDISIEADNATWAKGAVHTFYESFIESVPGISSLPGLTILHPKWTVRCHTSGEEIVE